MSRTVSPSSNEPYGVARVIAVWTWRAPVITPLGSGTCIREKSRRNVVHKVRSDEELLVEIRKVLAEPVFTGEGYRKIWARLRHQGVRTCKDRVLRLLREHQLLSPARQPEPMRGNPHQGTIFPRHPTRCGGPMRPQRPRRRTGR